MMLRPRHLVSLLLAAASSTVAFAQAGRPATFGPDAAQAPTVASPADSLNLRFANGIVAIAEDKIITVADVTREIAPFSSSCRQRPKARRNSMIA